MSVRSCAAKGTMFWLPDSKSKSKPSTTELPNGRGPVLVAVLGPKIDQMVVAADVAAEEEGNPPSV